MAYTNDLRTGMSMDYRKRLEMALQAQQQRSAMTGRPISPQERSSIMEGVLTPYAQSYGQNYMRGLELEQQQRMWNKRQHLLKRGLKQQKKAAQVSAIAEFAKLGLGAGYLAKSKGWGPWSTTQTTAPLPTTAETAPPLSAYETGQYPEDPQMVGYPRQVIPSYEDPSLELSPHDQHLWDYRGAEQMVRPGMGWRRLDAEWQAYWDFTQRRGI